MVYLFISAALVLVDQLVKHWVVANIPLWQSIPFIPHVMDLAYVQNTGAAFSLFNTHTWLLTVLSFFMTLVLLWLLLSGRASSRFLRFMLCLVLAGAVGNLIDRATLGYVVDMFQPIFINFAVFNVADICVVTGGIGGCIYYAFFDKSVPPHKDDKGDAPCA